MGSAVYRSGVAVLESFNNHEEHGTPDA